MATLLKEIADVSAVLAWSPARPLATVFASGTREGGGGSFEDYGGELRLSAFDLAAQDKTCHPLASIKTPCVATQPAWLAPTFATGVLVGARTLPRERPDPRGGGLASVARRHVVVEGRPVVGRGTCLATQSAVARPARIATKKRTPPREWAGFAPASVLVRPARARGSGGARASVVQSPRPSAVCPHTTPLLFFLVVVARTRFTALAWGMTGNRDQLPEGVVVGGMADGSLAFWDAARLRAGATGDGLLVVMPASKTKAIAKAIEFNPHPSQPIVAAGFADGELVILNLARPAPGAKFPTQIPTALTPAAKVDAEITSLAWNPSIAHILAVAHANGVVIVWDLKSLKPWTQLRDPVRCVSSRRRCAVKSVEVRE